MSSEYTREPAPHLAEHLARGADPAREEWRRFIAGEIGPLLMGRDLTRGGSFVKACEEIADVLYRHIEPEPAAPDTALGTASWLNPGGRS